jgi:putative membrane protein
VRQIFNFLLKYLNIGGTMLGNSGSNPYFDYRRNIMRKGLLVLTLLTVSGFTSADLLAWGGPGYGGYGGYCGGYGPGWGMGPGMWGYGPGFGYGFGGIFMGILFLIIIGVVIYFIVRVAKTKGSSVRGESALDILKKRLAGGEITKEEYNRIKDDVR